MTPLMRRFTVVLACKGMVADLQLRTMPSSTATSSPLLAQRKLQRGQGENHVLALHVSKAFATAPHGVVAHLMRHMGVPKELIKLFHTLSCPSTLLSITADGPSPSICLRRGLRQVSAKSVVLYLVLLESLLRSVASKASQDARHAVPPLVEACCKLIAHTIP